MIMIPFKKQKKLVTFGVPAPLFTTVFVDAPKFPRKKIEPPAGHEGNHVFENQSLYTVPTDSTGGR